MSLKNWELLKTALATSVCPSWWPLWCTLSIWLVIYFSWSACLLLQIWYPLSSLVQLAWEWCHGSSSASCFFASNFPSKILQTPSDPEDGNQETSKNSASPLLKSLNSEILQIMIWTVHKILLPLTLSLWQALQKFEISAKMTIFFRWFIGPTNFEPFLSWRGVPYMECAAVKIILENFTCWEKLSNSMLFLVFVLKKKIWRN